MVTLLQTTVAGNGQQVRVRTPYLIFEFSILSYKARNLTPMETTFANGFLSCERLTQLIFMRRGKRESKCKAILISPSSSEIRREHCGHIKCRKRKFRHDRK